MMPTIDQEDEVTFNFWVSVQVLALYLGEALGELLTGVLTDRHPHLLKKMLMVTLLLSGLRLVWSLSSLEGEGGRPCNPSFSFLALP